MKTKALLLTAILATLTSALPAETVPPIACNLKALTPEQRKQLEQIGAHVISAITASKELKDGYAFSVDPRKASLMDVAQWLDVWRRAARSTSFRSTSTPPTPAFGSR